MNGDPNMQGPLIRSIRASIGGPCFCFCRMVKWNRINAVDLLCGHMEQMRGTFAIGGTETADGDAAVVLTHQSLEKPAFSFIARKRFNRNDMKIGAQISSWSSAIKALIA